MLGMAWFHRQAFKVKISVLMTLASSLVLAIVSSCMILVEIGVYKKDLLREQLNILDVVAANLAAPLVFEDIMAIQETLAVFEKLPDTESLVLYNQLGQVVSRYGPQESIQSDELGSGSLQSLNQRSSKFNADRLVIQVPVFVEDEVVGSIKASTSLYRLHDKIRAFITVACAVFPFAFLLAFLLGRMFGRLLSRPIEQLAKTMAEVQNTKNFSLTADGITGYELTKLSESFDAMLNEIRIRDDLAKARKEELELQKTKAIQASQSKSEFLANMSHEIRTPMNGVMGMAQLLMRAELPRQEAQYAELIYESGEALMTILNDILDFSKIEAGHLELDPVQFDVTKAITNVTDLMDNNAREKGIKVSLTVDDNVPRYLIGDAGRIRQILLNLIGNAIKFTHEGGVSVKVSARSHGSTSDLEFYIADTGIGIPDEKLKSIFDKFTQAEGSTTRVFGGTGLGLSISKSLIDAMGGTIEVESSVGKGTAFKITIPLPTLSEEQLAPLMLKKAPKVRPALVYSKAKQLSPELTKYLQDKNLKPVIATDNARFISAIETLSSRGVVTQAIVSDMTSSTEETRALLSHIRMRASLPTEQVVLIIPDNVSTSKVKDALNHLPRLCVLTPQDLRSRNPIKISAKQNREMTPASAGYEFSENALQSDVSVSTKINAKRILIADDNDINLTHMSSVLTQTGYMVDLVKNGHEAYNAAKKYRYDAILMDLSMPVMNGDDALSAIRAYEATKKTVKVPIIAVTGHASTGDKALFLNAGFDGYVSKPIDNERLIQTLSTCLKAHAQSKCVAA